MPAKGRQPVSVEKLDQLADELRNRAASLSKLAKRMRAAKMKEIEVMNLPMAERGIESFRKFYLGCLKETGGD